MPFALLVLLVALVLPSAATAAEVPANATYTQEFFTTADGVLLHADVLRPKGLTPADKTPVVLTVSPYTNHSAQVATEFDPTQSGPSDRFYDLLEGAKLLDRGYTYVMVDLRGFGGSAGCNDWGGPGEQEDVRAAVRWAATQPWSTGKVALYGKSYDAWTGLMGIVQQPEGLAAVIAQEPVYDGYRYLHTHGVRFANAAGTPASFSATDAIPGALSDSPQYLLNGTQPNAPCYALNVGQQQQDDENSAFWKARELVSRADGVRIPLFMTQGFLETNTKPDGAWAFWEALDGPKKAWFGQFDHVRGNDVDATGRLGMGRPGWFTEVNAFLDEHLKGAPPAGGPAIAVQSSDGTWTAESQWPPADAVAAPLRAELNGGTYADNGANRGTGASGGQGIWTFSPPLPVDARLSGVSRITLTATPMVPRANLVANLYDVAPDGKATLLGRGAQLLRAAGPVDMEVTGQDWRLPAGHRVGVLLSGANAEWWQHVPTRGSVTVADARISLPFRTLRSETATPGTSNARLEAHRRTGVVQVTPETIAAGTRAAFPTPPAMVDAPPPAAGGTSPGTTADATPGAARPGGATGASRPATAATPRGCTSRRVLSLRLPKALRGKATRLTVTVDGKRRGAVRRGAAARRAVRVDLRGAKRSTVKVVLTARLTDGRTRRSVRTFRTCARR